MSLIWHNFILFIQLFKRLLNLKVDMKYTYSIVLSDKKFIQLLDLINTVTAINAYLMTIAILLAKVAGCVIN